MKYVFSSRQITEDNEGATGRRITEATLKYLLGEEDFKKMKEEIFDHGSAILAEYGGISSLTYQSLLDWCERKF